VNVPRKEHDMSDALEERLALRVQVFRETGQVRPEVAEFVEDELKRLANSGLPVSEETAGMLTSHLMTALDRLLSGEALSDPAADAQMTAELADHPGALELARRIAARAERVLGTGPLPASETNYLAMHLAVLAQRAPEPVPRPETSAAGTSAAENGEQP
jgi:hypothetical protein